MIYKNRIIYSLLYLNPSEEVVSVQVSESNLAVHT